jgi:hypothetical protein
MKRFAPFVLSLFVVAACGQADRAPGEPSPAAARGELAVEVVNYELVAGATSRFIVGLILPDNRLLAYGSVQMRFQALDDAGRPVGGVSEVVAGTYLPLPGTELGEPTQDPKPISPATVRGVYEVEGVRFSQPGQWAVEVAARVQGLGIVQGSAGFEVLAEPGAPGVGERAPRSDNPVIGDDVPAPELDSRAATRGRIPDPALHRTSIADAIRQGRPAAVIFSTPVYCVSRFCGPVTEMIQGLQRRYGERAEFIHVEIWKDFENAVANETAVRWLQREGELTEPWLFLIGADGRIAARWDNLVTRAEVIDGLEDALAIN